MIITGQFTALNGGNRTAALLAVEAFVVPDSACNRPKGSAWLGLSTINRIDGMVIEPSKAVAKNFSFDVIGEDDMTRLNVTGYVCLEITSVDSEAHVHHTRLPLISIEAAADRNTRTVNLLRGGALQDPFKANMIHDKHRIELQY